MMLGRRLLFFTRVSILFAFLLLVDRGASQGSPPAQSDSLRDLVVRVRACDVFTNRPDVCISSEQGNGLLVDKSGIVLTAYHIVDKDQIETSESSETAPRERLAAAPNFWPLYEVEFGVGLPGCEGNEGLCRAEVLAIAPEHDMALLQLHLEGERLADGLPEANSLTLNYPDERIGAETILNILGHSAEDKLAILKHKVESFNEDSASITITAPLQKGFSGAPAFADIDGQPYLVGIVSQRDLVDSSQTVIRTLNNVQGFYWRTAEGFSSHLRPFANIRVTVDEVQSEQKNVEIIHFSTQMMTTPQSTGTLLLYLFDEQQQPIRIERDGSWPTSFESQLIWTESIKGSNLVKPINVAIDLSDVFESINLESTRARIVMVDQSNRHLWSHEEWLQIDRPRIIPTPTPTPDPWTTPVDISSLRGRIAFTRLRNDDVWLTEIYCLQTDLPCQPLEHMRQPDFDANGRLLVNGTGNDKNDIMRMDAYFGQDKLLSRHPEDQRPHWSPSGDQFVYDSTSYGDGNSRIYIQSSLGRIDTGPKAAVFSGIDFIGEYPIFFSDGRIAYQGCDRWRQGGRLCGILVSGVPPYDVPRRITDRTDDLPTDRFGSRFLFMSKRTGNWDVYSATFDGTEITNLTNNPADDGLATASPDDQHIAFYSNRGGQWGVYIARADGSGVTLLLAIEGSDKKEWKEERISWGP